MSQFRLQSNINIINAQMRAQVDRAVRNTAFAIQAHIRLAMAEPKTGVMYGNHQASAPGEAPAVDTGALTNSIQVEVEGLRATVGTNMEYAEVLEFGGVHMQPRPYFGPAFEYAKPLFEAAVKKAVA